MELKSGATFDAKIKDVDEKADIALIKIDAPVRNTAQKDVNFDLFTLMQTNTLVPDRLSFCFLFTSFSKTNPGIFSCLDNTPS